MSGVDREQAKVVEQASRQALSAFADEKELTTFLGDLAKALVALQLLATSGRDNLRSIALTYAVADSAADGQRRELVDYLTPERSHA